MSETNNRTFDPSDTYAPLYERRRIGHEASRVLAACKTTDQWEEGLRMAKKLMSLACNADQVVGLGWAPNNREYGEEELYDRVKDMLDFLIQRGARAETFLAALNR